MYSKVLLTAIRRDEGLTLASMLAFVSNFLLQCVGLSMKILFVLEGGKGPRKTRKVGDPALQPCPALLGRQQIDRHLGPCSTVLETGRPPTPDPLCSVVGRVVPPARPTTLPSRWEVPTRDLSEGK